MLKKIQSFFNPTDLSSFKKSLRPNLANHCLTNKLDQKTNWVLIGVPDDRGVRNNHGRAGASQGPDSFRKFFYYHPIASVAPAKNSILDLGNFILHKDLEKSLDQLTEVTKTIYELGLKVLIVGGGHDIAYSEIAGAILSDKKTHHVLNIDAHADVRALEKNNVITSGTPFYRLIKSSKLNFKGNQYHPFGLQKMSNSQVLLDFIKKNKIDTYFLEEMTTDEEQKKYFLHLVKKISTHPWHFNIDLDGFSANHAPGVSAPASFGLHPNLILNLKKLKNLKSLGIYELSPPYDEGEKTARLAAKLAYYTLSICS
ncbi:MAG: formimidoylglutamase [Bacteriovoracaceae bacterium]|nr:formimidoylglutamase [Bacteriovoracaceae bacterium]